MRCVADLQVLQDLGVPLRNKAADGVVVTHRREPELRQALILGAIVRDVRGGYRLQQSIQLGFINGSMQRAASFLSFATFQHFLANNQIRFIAVQE